MTRHYPDSPVLADLAARWKSAYVHVPFCLRRCPYCDFTIVDESKDGAVDHAVYVDGVIREIALEPDFGSLDAVNFGGGTPSRLTVSQLGAIVEVLEDRFGFAEPVEVSLEVNPEDWSEEFGFGLAEAGFTRVSVGAQSFDPVVLGALGRVHSPEMIASTVAGARKAGIRSVGLDLIFGHPAESSQSWASTVLSALEVQPDHISTYSLTVEHGTQLSREIAAGAPAPDDDVQADRYEVFEQAAAKEGFIRYEISNHARLGHVCVYNLATWAHAEYVAFGIGAHGHRLGVRTRNHKRVDRYLDALDRGEQPIVAHELLSAHDQERDALMVGLRLAAGTPMTDMATRFADSGPGRRFLDAGILEVSSGRLRVMVPMMTDAVLREALSVCKSGC